MQTKMKTRVIGGFGAAALVALGMAISVPHMGAQQGPGQPPAGRMGRGPGGPGGPGMGRGGRGGPGGPMGLGVDLRDLTDAQRESIKAIRDRHAQDLAPVMERVRKAREALHAVVINGGDVRGVATEIGAAEGELAFQQAQIDTEVIALLTPEQKQKMLDREKEMEARRAEMAQRRQTRRGGPGNAK
jgi:Spy/CpxP family protein refolding chaperone